MEKFKRYLIFTLGLFISSLGVAVITKAGLGTSPISSIPYVLSLKYSMSLGEFTIIFNVVLIILQVLILRRNFKFSSLLQLPVTVLFGYFIDIGMLIFSFITPQAYLIKFICLLFGCAILGIGVYFEVLANVVMLPGESFVRAIVVTWNTEFGLTKIIFDSSMTILAAIMSLCISGELNGVREGTIIAAFLVGFIARQLGRIFSFLPDKLFPSTLKSEAKPESAVSAPTINCIAIGRQFGCGGSSLGEKLASRLGYTFYDKEVIKLAINMTGYNESFIAENEEFMRNSLLYDLENQAYSYANYERSPKDRLFDIESEVIRNLAAKGNCVIVGRCADAILKDKSNCLTLFLSAPLEYRIKHITEKMNLPSQKAEDLIRKTDKHRAENYRYYTGQTWGNASNYRLCVDTSLGEKYVIDLIETATKEILT